MPLQLSQTLLNYSKAWTECRISNKIVYEDGVKLFLLCKIPFLLQACFKVALIKMVKEGITLRVGEPTDK